MTKEKKGYMKDPHDIWDALTAARLNGTQFQVLCYLIHWTRRFPDDHGWRKIPLSTIATMTGRPKQKVSEAINKLEEWGMVASNGRKGFTKVYTVTDPANWQCDMSAWGKEYFDGGVHENVNSGIHETVNSGVPETVNTSGEPVPETVNSGVHENVHGVYTESCTIKRNFQKNTSLNKHHDNILQRDGGECSEGFTDDELADAPDEGLPFMDDNADTAEQEPQPSGTPEAHQGPQPGRVGKKKGEARRGGDAQGDAGDQDASGYYIPDLPLVCQYIEGTGWNVDAVDFLKKYSSPESHWYIDFPDWRKAVRYCKLKGWYPKRDHSAKREPLGTPPAGARERYPGTRANYEQRKPDYDSMLQESFATRGMF